MASVQELKFDVGSAGNVSALLMRPNDARACYVFAHGAGAGMRHASMEAIATGLADRGIATLRYQFPYMEKGGKRPDPPALAHATVRAAVAEAAKACAGLALIAGGKSFGGRMTSQAQAKAPLDGVKGLAFFGFPLHPAGEPAVDRAAHLFKVEVAMLFLQGTRDALADVDLLKLVVRDLRGVADSKELVTLHLADGADHSFHVLKSSGRNDGEVLAEILDVLARWVDEVALRSR
jgi:predicted alpha/beta-hydrolase family hydrolase